MPVAHEMADGPRHYPTTPIHVIDILHQTQQGVGLSVQNGTRQSINKPETCEDNKNNIETTNREGERPSHRALEIHFDTQLVIKPG